MADPGRFVCAVNKGRDFYQVPLALAEADLLSAFVTDFYAAPDAPGWLPDNLRRRRVDGIAKADVVTTPSTFLIQSSLEILKFPMEKVYPFTDGLLARKAARVVRRTGAQLYCYSPYLPRERDIPAGTRRVAFEFHPLPELLWDILSSDRARYPELEQSFKNEENAYRDRARYDVWRRADQLVCASSVTRRSLEVAGCDPARITVVPYGLDLPPERAVAPRRRGDMGETCEFLFVGQGVQRKGLHHLIEAWQAAELRHSRLTLVCYRIDPGVRAMIRSPSIRLLGGQSRAALDDLYDAADVFAMPSLVEGFGLVYLEALSRGCFTIGSRNSGLPDLDLPAEAAAVVDPGDSDALAAALRDAERRGLAGLLDRGAIRAAAGRWQWPNFRRAIADHARAALA